MKKIQLSKQTLRVLTASETDAVAGAFSGGRPTGCIPQTQEAVCVQDSMALPCSRPTRVPSCLETQGPVTCP